MAALVRRRASSEAGFSLVEVLVSTVLFALVMTSVAFLIYGNMKADLYARRMTSAVNLAQSKMEEIQNTPYAVLSEGSDAVTASGAVANAAADSPNAVAGTTYERSWTMIAGPSSNTKQVDVTVGWTESDGTLRTISLESLVVDN